MITFNPQRNSFKLDTPNTSYVMAVGKEFGYPLHYYYGRRLSSDDLSYLSLADPNASEFWTRREKLSYVDCVAMEYPADGTGDFRNCAIEVETPEGHSTLELKYDSYEIYKGKRKLEGLPATFGNEDECESLDIILKDEILKLKVILTYSVFEGIDAITRSVRVENEGNDIYLKKVMSTCLDLVNDDYEVLKLCGTWARERKIERVPLQHGYQGISSKRGISSHQENPFIALTGRNTTQTQGEVYAMNLVYSGNYDAQVYLNQFDYARMTMGINPYKFKWKLTKGESFTSPEAVMVYSSEGLGKMTRTFHDLYRKHLIRSPYKNKKRPILINNWEATYFDFNTEKLLDIAREASKVGIEMLVMDDGWFGDRNDDNKALGDWIVNEEKLPGGLKYLVDEVNKLGLKFGIWMEPEMICPDSDLYRAHPDWAIQVPGRTPGRSRNQFVLDLTRTEVMEHTWNSIKAVVDSANIEYVKWDMNRPLADIASLGLDGDRQGEFFHRYIMAVYELQGRLVDNYPNLLLENCSGGGGRFDPGMLYYSPQIWCSDDTDAIERLRIQEGTSLVYPLSSMGAHVSDCPNHILGRVTPFETRGHVALAGTFGYELDITKISAEDRDMIPKQVEMYHKYNDLVREGDYYRLASYNDNHEYDAWMVKAKDDSEILVTFVSVVNRPNMKPLTIKLQGLNPNKLYEDVDSKVRYTADTLMYAGIRESRIWGDYKSKLIHFVEVKE